MKLRATIKAVLKAMDTPKLIILCYDHFPRLYASFEPPRQSHRALVALLLDHATETDQLKRLAQCLELPTDEGKKPKADKVFIRIGNIGRDFNGIVAAGNVTTKTK